jgi:hypothetical protein
VADVAALRFDLRGHGESEGRQELTLATILNDIQAPLLAPRWISSLPSARCPQDIRSTSMPGTTPRSPAMTF